MVSNFYCNTIRPPDVNKKSFHLFSTRLLASTVQHPLLHSCVHQIPKGNTNSKLPNWFYKFCGQKFHLSSCILFTCAKDEKLCLLEITNESHYAICKMNLLGRNLKNYEIDLLAILKKNLNRPILCYIS